MRPAEVRQPSRIVERGLQRLTRHALVDLRIAGLDVEQIEIDVHQLLVGQAIAKPPGRIAAGVQAEFLQRRKMRVANSVCTIGSPPESVMPPLLILSTWACLPITCIAWATLNGLPFRLCQVSGLWQYWHRSRQPVRNATNRRPGPSTVLPSWAEWT